MKTNKYNTLRGLFRALKNKGAYNPVFTLSDYLNGRAILNGKWAKFILSDKLRDEVLQLFAGAIWERGAASKCWKLEGVKNYGIFRRVMIESRFGELVGSYCAGQDHTGEIRFIQKLINK